MILHHAFDKRKYATLLFFYSFSPQSHNHDSILDGLIPVVFLAFSISLFVAANVRYVRGTSAVYAPLKNTPFTGYGAANVDDPVDDDDDAASSDSTLSPAYEEQSTRWSFYNSLRLVGAVIQVCVLSYTFQQLLSGEYELDQEVEGTQSTAQLGLLGNLILWVRFRGATGQRRNG